MMEWIVWLMPGIILLGIGLAGLAGMPAIRGKIKSEWLGAVLAVFPLAAFSLLASQLSNMSQTGVRTAFEWLPSLGFQAVLYLDGLSSLFVLIITGIGALILLYAGSYLHGKANAWLLMTYLLMFMLAMVGLVLAGDILTLFFFWELTSITSFLLVAFNYKDEQARKGAFQALFITGGGGIALLAGLLFAAGLSNSTEISQILENGDLLRQHQYYPVILGLIAFGALTKSAQFPAHIWLPGAMAAPTPASAFLHSATMVKAGIYLLARLNPGLGNTDLWFWLFSLVGLITMLVGAVVGLRHKDIKALLAYSTISQLGVLVMLIGQDTEIAYKALVIGITAHALYKSALFMVAGSVDHATGTRDLTRLGGLAKDMRATFLLAGVAALSMAGLPPLFGFLAKETLLATATHPAVPAMVELVFPGVAVIAGAFLLLQAAHLIWEVFLVQPKDRSIHAHESPRLMLVSFGIPALISLGLGILPEPEFVAKLLALAAQSAYGAPVKVSLALWTGINVPLLLSALAISLGLALFWQRKIVIRGLERWTWDTNRLYDGTLAGMQYLAHQATLLQSGRLRSYLALMLITMLGLVSIFAVNFGVTVPAWEGWPEVSFQGVLEWLRLFALLLAVAAAGATIFLRRDFFAIMAMGAAGLAIAMLMVLEPAPDVALVQVVVDILALVILTLALTRLPRSQRQKAAEFTFRQSRLGLVRDGLISAAVGCLVFIITLVALSSRPRQSVVTPFYEQNAKPLTGAADIVGAIVVDFRGFDTLIEISVFALAGVGIYTLLRYAARKHGDHGKQIDELPPPKVVLRGMSGIGGGRTSPFIHALAYVILPVAAMLAFTHMMYGHDQPGDGFTAGVILSLGVGFWYLAFGFEETRRKLTWLRPLPLIAVGIVLGIGNGVLSTFLTGAFLAPVDYGKALGSALPVGFAITNSFIFEVAIFLTVLGSGSLILDTLSHPGVQDTESEQRIEDIAREVQIEAQSEQQ